MVTITLIYDTDDDRTDVLARVLESLTAHSDAAFELISASAIAFTLKTADTVKVSITEDTNS